MVSTTQLVRGIRVDLQAALSAPNWNYEQIFTYEFLKNITLYNISYFTLFKNLRPNQLTTFRNRK